MGHVSRLGGGGGGVAEEAAAAELTWLCRMSQARRYVCMSDVCQVYRLETCASITVEE